MGEYVVQQGDSWAKIAGKLYGDQRAFAQLMAANGGKLYLKPGMKLSTPGKVQKGQSAVVSQSLWDAMTGKSSGPAKPAAAGFQAGTGMSSDIPAQKDELPPGVLPQADLRALGVAGAGTALNTSYGAAATARFDTERGPGNRARFDYEAPPTIRLQSMGTARPDTRLGPSTRGIGLANAAGSASAAPPPLGIARQAPLGDPWERGRQNARWTGGNIPAGIGTYPMIRPGNVLASAGATVRLGAAALALQTRADLTINDIARAKFPEAWETGSQADREKAREWARNQPGTAEKVRQAQAKDVSENRFGLRETITGQKPVEGNVIGSQAGSPPPAQPEWYNPEPYYRNGQIGGKPTMAEMRYVEETLIPGAYNAVTTGDRASLPGMIGANVASLLYNRMIFEQGIGTRRNQVVDANGKPLPGYGMGLLNASGLQWPTIEAMMESLEYEFDRTLWPNGAWIKRAPAKPVVSMAGGYPSTSWGYGGGGGGGYGQSNRAELWNWNVRIT